ncbi:MAG: hypothetical protein GC155_02875 [Alphaproteobacteria bacterium]|nr:hypothetical protein [Alphaproteobacteria bacterium]
MPLYAQIITMGGNGVIGLVMLLGASESLSKGSFGVALLLALLAGACGYTIWVLAKFRRYLSEEARLTRELRLEHLRDELDAEHAKRPASGETPENSIH